MAAIVVIGFLKIWFHSAPHEIRGNHHGSGFIALGQEREEHFHLITVMLDIADVIENDAGKLIELG